MQSDIVIEAVDLKKVYKRHTVEAVKGISFTVKSGICFGILGPNGAGKSTTMEMLQGILKPTSGTLKLFGTTYTQNATAIKSRMGGILQENKLYGKLKVREAIELFQSFYKKPKEVHEVLSILNLQSLSERYLMALSGGQRQRVFIGTVLVGDPDLIFLDEPTTGLDPTTRNEFWSLIRNLKEEKKTIVLTTHYMEEAETLCDELIVVDGGIIIESGSPTQLIERVMSGFVVPEKPRQATLNDVFLKLTGRSLSGEVK